MCERTRKRFHLAGSPPLHACLFFERVKFSVSNQGLYAIPLSLLTILSTEFVQKRGLRIQRC